MKKIINTPDAPRPVGSYSQAVKVNKILFVSGQLPIDPETGKIVRLEMQGQTETVMENIKAILKASNYSFDDVVQVNVFLSSMAMFSEFNNTYAKYFTHKFPARATVGATLPTGALLEVSVVAYRE